MPDGTLMMTSAQMELCGNKIEMLYSHDEESAFTDATWEYHFTEITEEEWNAMITDWCVRTSREAVTKGIIEDYQTYSKRVGTR